MLHLRIAERSFVTTRITRRLRKQQPWTKLRNSHSKTSITRQQNFNCVRLGFASIFKPLLYLYLRGGSVQVVDHCLVKNKPKEAIQTKLSESGTTPYWPALISGSFNSRRHMSKKKWVLKQQVARSSLFFWEQCNEQLMRVFISHHSLSPPSWISFCTRGSHHMQGLTT